MKRILSFWICLGFVACGPAPAHAQPTPPANVTLTVNKTTGAIVAPVDAATFASANGLGGGGGGGAPTTATYITQTPNGTLTSEQALSLLSTGLLKVTTTTGVLSTATAGTDYLTPAGAAAAYQPLDSDLTAIAALSTTTFGRSSLTLADAAAGRTLFGLGTLATQSGTFSGTSSGTNTGDQTITLTGQVTGSGTGSFATVIATGAVGPTELASTAVAAGSYTNTNLTVDADGRITAASNGSGGGISGLSTNGAVYAASSTTVGSTAALTNGQLLIGSTGSTPVAAALTAGTNVTITNSAGGITIAATAGAGGYATVQEEGSNLTARTTVNFVGATVTAADDAGNSRTNVTVSAAPISPTFITQTADATLTNEQAMGSLATGIVKNTTTTGVQSIAVAGTDYEVPVTFSTGLTRSTNTVTVNTSQNIGTLSNLTSNGFVKTSGGTGALSIDTASYQPLDAALTALAGGSDFVAFSGPTTSTKTFTLPNATASILTDNAAVTGAQGGTGVSNSGKTITLAGNLTTVGGNVQIGPLTTAGVLVNDASGNVTSSTSYVAGPASATADNLAVFDGTTGKLVKDSGIVPITATLTNHGAVIATGATGLTSVSPSTAGFVLTSNGASADPSFQAASGGGIANISNQQVLGSGYTITGNATYQDTGVALSIPSAGTYLITSNVRVQMQMSSASGYVGCQLYDNTNAAAISNSQRLVLLVDNTVSNQQQSAYSWIVTTAGAVTLNLQAARTVIGGTFTIAAIQSDSAGYTTMAYVKLQ